MTTDAGIDLVAYSAGKKRSFTIQVKTNLAPKPTGGKGSPAIDWWGDENCPAELIAFADISTRRVWLFTSQELASKAQQHSSGRLGITGATEQKTRLRNQKALRSLQTSCGGDVVAQSGPLLVSKMPNGLAD